MKRLVFVLIAACAVPEKPVTPPSKEDVACRKAVSCEIYSAERHCECVVCVKRALRMYDGWLKLIDLPSVDELSCEQLRLIGDGYGVSECIQKID